MCVCGVVLAGMIWVLHLSQFRQFRQFRQFGSGTDSQYSVIRSARAKDPLTPNGRAIIEESLSIRMQRPSANVLNQHETGMA